MNTTSKKYRCIECGEPVGKAADTTLDDNGVCALCLSGWHLNATRIADILRDVNFVLRHDGGSVFVGQHMEIRREWVVGLLRELRRLNARRD